MKANTLLKKGMTLVLALCILGTTVSAAFPDTGVTDEMLFFEYPQYLSTKAAIEYIGNAFTISSSIFASQKGKNAAIVATILDDGTTIGLQEAAAKLGWSKSYHESILESATEKFLCALSAGDSDAPALLTKNTDEMENPLSALNDLRKALPKDQTVEILKNMLDSMGIKSSETKSEGLYMVLKFDLPKDAKMKEDADKLSKSAIALTAMYCYQNKMVDFLMEEVDKGSDLFAGLTLLKSRMSNPSEYFKKYYIRKAVLDGVEKWLSENATNFVTEAIGMSAEMMSVVSLCKTLYFKFVYDGYKVNDLAEGVYLLSFADSIEQRLSEMRTQFRKGELNSKSDIDKYKALLETEVYSLVATLNVSTKLVGRNRYYENPNDDGELLAINLAGTRGYGWYMYAAKKALADDLKAGKAIKVRTYAPSVPTGTTANTGTTTSAPSNLQIKLDKTTYVVGETVTITPSAKNTSGYLASVWYGAFRTGTRMYISNTFTGSVTFKPDKAGTYTVRVDANNAKGRDKGYISAETTFTVTNAQETPYSGFGVADGTYYIEAYCGKVVEVADSRKDDKANVQIWAKSSRDLGCQKFKITKSGDYYTITAVHSGKALDVADGSAESGTNVWQWHVNNTAAQQWSFEDAGNGYVYIRSALGTYLDVKKNGTDNGTNVWAYEYNGREAQMFRLVPIK